MGNHGLRHMLAWQILGAAAVMRGLVAAGGSRAWAEARAARAPSVGARFALSYEARHRQLCASQDFGYLGGRVWSYPRSRGGWVWVGLPAAEPVIGWGCVGRVPRAFSNAFFTAGLIVAVARESGARSRVPRSRANLLGISPHAQNLLWISHVLVSELSMRSLCVARPPFRGPCLLRSGYRRAGR